MTSAWQVGIVVPARDEQLLLGRCLAALEVAVEQLRDTRPDVAVRTCVVLDSCTDDSAAIVSAFPWAQAVPCSAGRVGAARRDGVAHVTATAVDADRFWIATTDADSAVPATWLTAHLESAEAGAAVLVGMVTLDLPAADPAVRAALAPDPELHDGHDHVYGANLGLTLAAYRASGGFEPVAAHEDVGLVRRARALGLRVRSTGRPAVLTSPRLQARAPDGLAAYLRALVEPPAESAS